MPFRKRAVLSGLAVGLAFGLAVAVAAPAAALSQITGPYQCTTNTYVLQSSTTKGSAYHFNSWAQTPVYKGYSSSWKIPGALVGPGRSTLAHGW